MRFLTADLRQPMYALTSSTRLPADADVVIVLPAQANAETVAFVQAMLGPTAIEITPTPTLPSGSEPLVRIFARGAAAIALMSEP